MKNITMNRRGLTVPLNFLIGIVIAIIIFFPVSVAIAKVLGINREGQKSYAKLVEELQDFDENTSRVLYLASETMVVYFGGGQPMNVNIQGMGNQGDFNCARFTADVTVTKPPQCSGEAPCLCLFSEVDTDYRFLLGPAEATITGTTVHCTQDLPQNLHLDPCSIGQPYQIVEYDCHNGFVIEREVFKKAGLSGCYLLNPSRILLNLREEQDTDTIILEAQQ